MMLKKGTLRKEGRKSRKRASKVNEKRAFLGYLVIIKVPRRLKEKNAKKTRGKEPRRKGQL